MERFILLVVGIVLVAYFAPMTYITYMLLEKPGLAAGNRGGCNSTKQMCLGVNGQTTGGNANVSKLMQASNVADFDLMWGVGYTMKVGLADVNKIVTNGVTFDGYPCDTLCSKREDDGFYYCKSAMTAFPNVMAGCSPLGKDWTGSTCPQTGKTKDTSMGVFICSTSKATHPPFCFDGTDVYTCTLNTRGRV